jgi:hypothetical protein
MSSSEAGGGQANSSAGTGATGSSSSLSMG